MLAHHLDSRRVLRILVLIWILLVILVLLPVRTHGQESLVPPTSSELVEENPAMSPEFVNAIAIEVMFLCGAWIGFLLFHAHCNHKTHVHKLVHR